MENTEVLQRTLNATIERMGRQAMNYESEIANLNAQIVILQSQLSEKTDVAEFTEATPAKTAKTDTKPA